MTREDPGDAREVVNAVARTAREMMNQFGEDPEYSNLHRLASEQLLAAVQGNDEIDEGSLRRSMSRLGLSEEYAKQALLKAKNTRQRMLTMGLIMTVNGVRTLLETGLETFTENQAKNLLDTRFDE